MPIMIINYTITNHVARIALDLSMNEYAVADLIYHLSNNPKSSIPGWCYATKETMAEMLGLSKQSIHNILNTLLEKEIITKNEETAYLRANELWYQTVVIKQREDSSPIGKKVHSDSKESLPSVKKVYSDSKESLLGGSKDSLHYNDNTNNDSNNDISTNVDNGQAVVLAEAETSLVIDGKTFNETIYLFKPVNPSVNRLFAQKGQRSALERLIKQHGIEKIRGMIELLPLLLKEPYAPIITTPYQLEAKLGQVIAFMERRKHGESKRGIDARGVK